MRPLIGMGLLRYLIPIKTLNDLPQTIYELRVSVVIVNVAETALRSGIITTLTPNFIFNSTAYRVGLVHRLRSGSP